MSSRVICSLDGMDNFSCRILAQHSISVCKHTLRLVKPQVQPPICRLNNGRAIRAATRISMPWRSLAMNYLQVAHHLPTNGWKSCGMPTSENSHLLPNNGIGAFQQRLPQSLCVPWPKIIDSVTLASRSLPKN